MAEPPREAPRITLDDLRKRRPGNREEIDHIKAEMELEAEQEASKTTLDDMLARRPGDRAYQDRLLEEMEQEAESPTEEPR